ncbi:MAG: hypothetical protein LBC75_06405 [Fibromonadaceae bacterium]|nr:hypothetical protein [Fibromonadaceae bacterium]
MKFFRVLLVMVVVAVVGASIYLFFETERKYNALNEIEPRAEAIYSSWLQQNNCNENLEPCLAYSEQFREWRSQMKQYKERKVESPEFKSYIFLKELDAQNVPDLNSGGLASLAAACAVLLLFIFLLVHILGSEKKTKNTYKIDRLKIEPSFKSSATSRQNTPWQAKPIKVHVALLRKAAECAKNEPAQAISYLDQAIEGSLGSKLSTSALLLSGSLRLKNKIGEKQGREQLQKVISTSPQSSEAKKAQMVLNAFK